MRILWVEDDSNVVTSGIFDEKYFHKFLSDDEIIELESKKGENQIKVKKYLKTVKNPIFLAQDMKTALELIEKEPPFDKIVLDIRFPIDDIDLYDYLKDDIKSKKEDALKFIKDDFSGILLNHIIVKKYKNFFKWGKDKILNSICFFTGNSITVDSFKKEIESKIDHNVFRYDSDAEEIKSFSKKETPEQFLSWLVGDEYTLIFKKYLPENIVSSAVENFLEVTRNKDSLDKTIIKGNLVHLRQLLEKYIAKVLSKDKKFIMGNFIKSLKQIKMFFDENDDKNKSYLILKSDEISKLISDINSGKQFNKEKDKIYKFSFGAFETFVKQKNENSFDAFVNNCSDMEKISPFTKNEYSKEYKVTETIYFYLQNCWDTLSKLIHDDEKLSEKGEDFIQKEERAVNIVNILYYQLKEIILWFGDVMKSLK
ncbi:hypothetical protein JXR93_02110 [bacterium]|nr:hypothetical protein [bacterium]